MSREVQKCLAVIPAWSPETWKPCGNDAMRSGLCKEHHETFMGIVLGLKNILMSAPDPRPYHESEMDALILLTAHRDKMHAKRLERIKRRRNERKVL